MNTIIYNTNLKKEVIFCFIVFFSLLTRQVVAQNDIEMDLTSNSGCLTDDLTDSPIPNLELAVTSQTPGNCKDRLILIELTNLSNEESCENIKVFVEKLPSQSLFAEYDGTDDTFIVYDEPQGEGNLYFKETLDPNIYELEYKRHVWDNGNVTEMTSMSPNSFIIAPLRLKMGSNEQETLRVFIEDDSTCDKLFNNNEQILSFQNSPTLSPLQAGIQMESTNIPETENITFQANSSNAIGEEGAMHLAYFKTSPYADFPIFPDEISLDQNGEPIMIPFVADQVWNFTNVSNPLHVRIDNGRGGGSYAAEITHVIQNECNVRKFMTTKSSLVKQNEVEVDSYLNCVSANSFDATFEISSTFRNTICAGTELLISANRDISNYTNQNVNSDSFTIDLINSQSIKVTFNENISNQEFIYFSFGAIDNSSYTFTSTATFPDDICDTDETNNVSNLSINTPIPILDDDITIEWVKNGDAFTTLTASNSSGLDGTVYNVYVFVEDVDGNLITRSNETSSIYTPAPLQTNMTFTFDTYTPNNNTDVVVFSIINKCGVEVFRKSSFSPPPT